MLSADQILATIDEAYEARVRGDKEKVQTYWAEGATFRIAGAESLMGPDMAGPSHPNEAIAALIDSVKALLASKNRPARGGTATAAR